MNALDRQTTARLNPLISPIHTRDTLSLVSGLLCEVGHAISTTACLAGQPNTEGAAPLESMYLILGAAAAALDYEAEHGEGRDHA
jgi:hypothetical protein